MRINQSLAPRIWAVLAATLVVALVPPASAAPPNPQPPSAWDEQFRSTGGVWVNDIAVGPDGHVATVGFARGALDDQAAIGGLDAFVRLSDPNGTLIWTRQFGSVSSDVASDVSWIDAETLVVAGWSESLIGTTARAGDDVFVMALRLDGSIRWIDQFGTDEDERPAGIITNDDRIAVVGNTKGDLIGTGVADDDGDVFIRVLDHQGGLVWQDQFGTSSTDWAYDATLVNDAGLERFVVGGETSGSLGGSNAGLTDAWMRFYDTAGGVVSTRQFGSAAADRLVALDASATRLHATGTTLGDLFADANGADIFISAHELDGTLLWGTHLPGTGDDRATDVLSRGGGLIASGYTNGSPGGPNAGAVDAITSAVDADGTILWIDQIGTPVEDVAWTVAASTDDTLFVAGATQGDLFEPNVTPLDWQEGWISAHPPPAVAAPSSPVVAVRALADALEVRWSGPSGAGTSTQVSVVDGPSCVTGTTRCVIADLDPDTEYAVTVSITNSAGTVDSAALAPVSPLVACDGTQPLVFDDIAPTSFARLDVACTFAIDVTTGTTVDTYSPLLEVSREQMSAFLARLYRYLTGEPCDDAHPFTDVPATSFAAADIACIHDLGVTTGTSPTTYTPTANVTREQMAAFLARLYRLLTGEPCDDAHPFTDVPATSFAAADIACIHDLGVTTGTSPTTYTPTADVTREQMAAFLARLYRLLSDPAGPG